jgi:hypothetical protein
VAIWYILWLHIWYIFPVVVCCTKKNLATLLVIRSVLQDVSFFGVFLHNGRTLATKIGRIFAFGQFFTLLIYFVTFNQRGPYYLPNWLLSLCLEFSGFFCVSKIVLKRTLSKKFWKKFRLKFLSVIELVRNVFGKNKYATKFHWKQGRQYLCNVWEMFRTIKSYFSVRKIWWKIGHIPNCNNQLHGAWCMVHV